MNDIVPKTPKIRVRARPAPESAISIPEAQPASPPADYDVGFGKPPVGHRFKPGQSGNPKGRPKGAKGVNTIVRELLEQKFEMQIGGRVRKVTRVQALLMKQMELASKGDARATALLINSYRLAVPDQTAPAQTEPHPDAPAELSATQAAMLEMFAEEVRAGAFAATAEKGGAA